MAKQKIPTEDVAQGVGAETFQEQTTEGVALQEETTVETVPADEQTDAPQPKQQATPPNEKRETKQSTQEPDSFILGVLKSFPNHKSLYVDKQGGVFTPDTAERIRGNATLYKNPYFKQN